MQKRAIRTTDYRIGETITLKALREVLRETETIDENAIVSIEIESGQRDATYYHVVIRELF